jgi:hypothetical protein
VPIVAQIVDIRSSLVEVGSQRSEFKAPDNTAQFAGTEPAARTICPYLGAQADNCAYLSAKLEKCELKPTWRLGDGSHGLPWAREGNDRQSMAQG